MDQLMPVERAAKMLGVHPKTARDWDEQGKSVSSARRVASAGSPRKRRSPPGAASSPSTAGSPRASGKRVGQMARIGAVTEQAAKPPFAEVIPITDMAFGLSDRRTGLSRLMSLAREGRVTDRAVAGKDRLTRFSASRSSSSPVMALASTWWPAATTRSRFRKSWWTTVCIDTTFSGKLYGLGSHHKAKELVAKVKEGGGG